MSEQKKYIISKSQVWTIGKATRDRLEYYINKINKIRSKDEVKLGLECEIIKIRGTLIRVRDIKTNTEFEIKSQSLGKRLF